MKSSKTYRCGTLRWAEFKGELLASAWPTGRTLTSIQVQLHFALWNFSGELSVFLEIPSRNFSKIPDLSVCGALEGAGGPAQLFDIATPLGMYKVRAPEPRSQVMRKHDPLQLPHNPPSVLDNSMVFCEASVIVSPDCMGRGPDTPTRTNYCWLAVGLFAGNSELWIFRNL